MVWLDLSFNNIEKIEGLDNLTKLKDLSLYNNQIKKIENINALEKLEVFSIGNNQLTDISNVSRNSETKLDLLNYLSVLSFYLKILYLRNFRELKTTCLRGNPFCERDDFMFYVLAHLNQIIYLDYRLVDQNLVS